MQKAGIGPPSQFEVPVASAGASPVRLSPPARPPRDQTARPGAIV